MNDNKERKMLIQLCYASVRVEGENDLLLDLSDILVTARNFNAENSIFGVLYYADGSFFQCLEGQVEDVLALFQKIQQDKRHHQVQQFAIKEISEITFKQWSMKYVNSNTKIANFFKSIGLNKFEPHHLNSENIHEFLKILLKTANTEKPIKPSIGYQNRGYQNYF
ncbi:BLUF domain-containing protein [Acinetobacter sichuanensis]|uniref:BLUF domain-containing protein n=2 Tax=Acinetobacter sichuanensis TaxID=2136183 RepID=A0ABV7BHQ6_9GAMM|nr:MULTISPECIES: BLUF domain-containing protein [Acinetobacter]